VGPFSFIYLESKCPREGYLPTHRPTLNNLNRAIFVWYFGNFNTTFFEGRRQIGFGRGYTWLCDDARATETKTEKERERERGKQQSNNEQTS